METSSAGMSERDLVARVIGGDHDAFGELVRGIYPRLVRVAQHVVHNSADAEDVVQEALWNAFRDIAQYRAEASFAAWLTRITVNEGINLIRRRALVSFEDEWAQRRAAKMRLGDPTPEESAGQAEVIAILYRCINGMPPTFRCVLMLSTRENLDHREIGRRLGLIVSNVKTRLHRARHALRQVLQS